MGNRRLQPSTGGVGGCNKHLEFLESIKNAACIPRPGRSAAATAPGVLGVRKKGWLQRFQGDLCPQKGEPRVR